MSVSDISTNKRPRPRKEFNYPASKRRIDDKSAIRCKFCGSQQLSLKYTTVYTRDQRCDITNNDVIISKSREDVYSITPLITILCGACQEQFDLRLYEDKGNVVIDRI